MVNCLISLSSRRPVITPNKSEKSQYDNIAQNLKNFRTKKSLSNKN